MASLPGQASILLTIGEIDCRPDEGIVKAWKKSSGKSLEALALATVSSYVAYVDRIAARHGHRLIVGGVPAINSRLKKLAPDITNQLAQLIRFFNKTLKGHALSAGMDFLDVHALTDQGDGTASGDWHVDDTHLTPAAVVEAFSRHMISSDEVKRFI